MPRFKKLPRSRTRAAISVGEFTMQLTSDIAFTYSIVNYCPFLSYFKRGQKKEEKKKEEKKKKKKVIGRDHTKYSST